MEPSLEKRRERRGRGGGRREWEIAGDKWGEAAAASAKSRSIEISAGIARLAERTRVETGGQCQAMRHHRSQWQGVDAGHYSSGGCGGGGGTVADGGSGERGRGRGPTEQKEVRSSESISRMASARNSMKAWKHPSAGAANINPHRCWLFLSLSSPSPSPPLFLHIYLSIWVTGRFK